MPSIRLHPAAHREILAASRWYDSRVSGLGHDFLAELDRTLELIATSPSMWPLWPGVQRSLAIRQALLSRFPYGIPYARVETGIVVFAVAHLARKPGYWSRRL